VSHRPGGLGRIGPALIAALAVPWLAGCSLLGFPYGGDFDDFPTPSIVASYKTGSASITLGDGTVILLDKLSDNAVLDAAFGASVRWSGPGGWHLTLSGAGAGAGEMYGSPAALRFDRVADSEHWTIWDESRCIVDVERATATGVEGVATCKGLQWTNALDQPWISEPEPIDEPKFDAEITFEARP